MAVVRWERERRRGDGLVFGSRRWGSFQCPTVGTLRSGLDSAPCCCRPARLSSLQALSLSFLLLQWSFWRCLVFEELFDWPQNGMATLQTPLGIHIEPPSHATPWLAPASHLLTKHPHQHLSNLSWASHLPPARDHSQIDLVPTSPRRLFVGQCNSPPSIIAFRVLFASWCATCQACLIFDPSKYAVLFCTLPSPFVPSRRGRSGRDVEKTPHSTTVSTDVLCTELTRKTSTRAVQ